MHDVAGFLHTAFLRSKGYSVLEFYEVLKEASVEGGKFSAYNARSQMLYWFAQRTKDETSYEALFAQILVAVTEFDVFMMIMREKREKMQHK